MQKRAEQRVREPHYLKKVRSFEKAVDKDELKTKFAVFPVKGRTIGIPYTGDKKVRGYLKKESAHVGVLLSKFWAQKFFTLDLYKFRLTYSVDPTSRRDRTVIPLSSVIDIQVQPEKTLQERNRSASPNGFFGLGAAVSSEEFVFDVKTNDRVYRLAADNKSDYDMWLQAFSVIFELRLLVQDAIFHLPSAARPNNATTEKENRSDIQKIEGGSRPTSRDRLVQIQI